MRLGRSVGTKFRAMGVVVVEGFLMQKEQHDPIHRHKNYSVSVVGGGWEGPSERLRLRGGRRGRRVCSGGI